VLLRTYRVRTCSSVFRIRKNDEIRGSEVTRGEGERRTGVAVLTQLPVTRIVAHPLRSFLAFDVD